MKIKRSSLSVFQSNVPNIIDKKPWLGSARN